MNSNTEKLKQQIKESSDKIKDDSENYKYSEHGSICLRNQMVIMGALLEIKKSLEKPYLE